MEGTLAEVRIFAGNFAPLGWAFCQGQIMAIRQNTALFSLLGNVYGGDGSTTFALPDFQGRTAVGTGQGPGLSAYNAGQKTGVEGVTLTIPQMPQHTHTAITQPGAGATATATLMAVNGSGGAGTPGGNYIGEDSASGLTSYANSGTPVAMNAGAIQVNMVTAPLPTVIDGVAGGSQPHINIQPALVLYYVICISGVYPPRGD